MTLYNTKLTRRARKCQALKMHMTAAYSKYFALAYYVQSCGSEQGLKTVLWVQPLPMELPISILSCIARVRWKGLHGVVVFLQAWMDMATTQAWRLGPHRSCR